MIKRDFQVLGAVGLAGWLLLAGATTASAQPAEPTPPAAAATPAETSAAPEVAPAATPADPVVDKTDKPGDKTDKTVAKPGAPANGAALPPGTSIKVERTSRGAKLFRITEGLVVEGQMQRPNAFLVLQRATVDYDYEALSASFLPRIVAATREKPF